MNKKITNFFIELYNREQSKKSSLFIPAHNNVILIDYNYYEDSKLRIGYMPIDSYSSNEIDSITEEIIVSLLGLSMKDCHDESVKTLGRINGDFIFKGKPIHYIILVTKKSSQGIEINISFSE